MCARLAPPRRAGSDTAGSRSACRPVGTHFWNPPYLIPLVEVVQGERTSAVTVERTMDVLRAAGKLPVRVHKDAPGFVANRLQHALWREAMSIVEQGIASRHSACCRRLATKPGAS